MRREGLGVSGIIAVLGMAGGAWFGLRPFLAPETVKIAFLGPEEHPDPQADAIEEGARLAMGEWGMRAGRFRVRYERVQRCSTVLLKDGSYRLTLWDPGEDENVVAVIDAGGESFFEPGRFNLLHLLTVSAIATNPDLTRPPLKDHPQYPDYRPAGTVNFFRVLPSADRMGIAGAEWVRSLGFSKVYLLRTLFDDESALVTAAFREHAKRLGLTIVDEQAVYEPWNSLADEILETRPDLVFLAGGNTEAPLKFCKVFSDLREKGYGGGLMVTDAWRRESFISTLNPLPERTRLVSLLPPTPDDFERAFRASFGKSPALHAYYGYLACRAILRALERADSKGRETVCRACATLPCFDANGDPASPAVTAYVVKNGRFEFVETLK